jgi:sulfur carrier protein ThiS
MEVVVEHSTKNKEVSLPKGSTVEDLLLHLSIFPDSVIVVSENDILPSSAQLTSGLRLRIIQVSSGG